MVDVLGIAALVAAFAVPGTIEFMKKPRLRIEPVPWQHPGDDVRLMTFAAVEVRNKPWPAPLSFLTRSADACRVSIDWRTLGEAGKVGKFDTMPGRWDKHDQPLKEMTSSSVTFPPGYTYYGGTVPTTGPGAPTINYSTRYAYDPDRVTAEQTIAVGSDLGRVSVAVLRRREAFAFSDESYAFMSQGLGNPAWRLEIGKTYLVDVHVKGSNAKCDATFELEYLSHNFEKFRLRAVER
jgi:hypothetical protein